MAGIAAQILSPKPEENDEERLLKLFWNRAELKKEFAGLRREGEDLKEKLQQQEGVVVRAQQKLDQLEGMLADPLQAANASVFYQLRGVWASCRRKLTRLAKDLAVNQSEREHHSVKSKFEAAQRAQMQVLDGHIQKAKSRETTLAEELRVLYERHESMRGFWNYFKRRTLLVEVEALEGALQAAQVHSERCSAAKAEKLAEACPEFDGLSIAGRRKINLALIAIAQELFIHFSPREVSTLAREASVREITDANYGGIALCHELNVHIEKCTRELPIGDAMVAKVRQRASFLEGQASYRRDEDTVPVAGSFADIQLDFDVSSSTQRNKTVPINVLVDEYWDIYTVLLT